jgi:ABC-type transport system substrate-binding protein
MLEKFRPLMMAFSFLFILNLLLSACGAAPGASTPSEGGTPVKGGTWIDDLFEEPDSLLPNASNETFAAMVMYGLYAPLIYGDPQGKIHAGIATEVPTLHKRLPVQYICLLVDSPGHYTGTCLSEASDTSSSLYDRENLPVRSDQEPSPARAGT